MMTLRANRTLAPGIWVDENEALHFSIPDLLKFFGWEDTRATRRELDSLIRETWVKNFPDAPIVYQEACPNCQGTGEHKEGCPLR